MAKSKKNIRNINHSGFSLIEMILVIFISSVIALAAGQTFLVATNTYGKTKDVQKNLEDGRSSMEMMTKDIRMSSYANHPGAGTVSSTIFMYNNSKKMCVSYQFDAANSKLLRAECAPPTDAGIPVGPGGPADYDNACNANAGNPCVGNNPYSYSSVSEQEVAGSFDMRLTDRNGSPKSVGKATITMTLGSGTSTTETLQTSVSFRDYADVVM